VRDPRVVLGDVELDELPHARDRVERVQEEPVVLEAAPPRLDHRVREVDLGHGEHSLEEPGLDQLVDGAVPVLDAGIRDECRGRSESDESAARFDEDGDRVADVEVVCEPPGEDSSREVVDHGVEVRARPVEETDHGSIHMEELVRPRGADPDLRAFRMNSEPRASPSSLTDEPQPGRGRGEDDAHPLRQDREPSRRDVPELGRLHHLADLCDFLDGQPVRRRRRAGFLLGEFARSERRPPRVQPRRREADELQDSPKPDDPPRAIDGADEALLVVGRDPELREAGLEDPCYGEEHAQHGCEQANSPLEFRDPKSQPRQRRLEFRDARHRGTSLPDPAGRRRSRNADPGGDGDVARVLDELNEAVVVRAVRALRGHDPRITRGDGKGKTARKSRSTIGVGCPTETSR